MRIMAFVPNKSSRGGFHVDPNMAYWISWWWVAAAGLLFVAGVASLISWPL